LEPDLQVGEIFCRHGGSHEAVKILQQVFLTRLPEREAIDGQASLEPAPGIRALGRCSLTFPRRANPTIEEPSDQPAC